MPDNQNSSELALCPFCRGRVRRDDRTEYQSYSASESQSMGMGVSAGGFSSTTYAIQCECGIRVEGNNDDIMVARWNRRPAPAMLNGVEGLLSQARAVLARFRAQDDDAATVINRIDALRAADNRDAAGVELSERLSQAEYDAEILSSMERLLRDNEFGFTGRWDEIVAQLLGRLRTAPTAAPAGEAVYQLAAMDNGPGVWVDADKASFDWWQGRSRAGRILYTHPPAAEVREVEFREWVRSNLPASLHDADMVTILDSMLEAGIEAEQAAIDAEAKPEAAGEGGCACGNCGASSEYASTDVVAEAVAAWNRRTALTPPAGGLPEPKFPVDGAGDEDSYNSGWNDCLKACHAYALEAIAASRVPANLDAALNCAVSELEMIAEGRDTVTGDRMTFDQAKLIARRTYNSLTAAWSEAAAPQVALNRGGEE